MEIDMPKSTDASVLVALSDAMANAVEKAGASTVMVNARQRFPASGVVFASDLVLTANHVVERDEDITVGLPDGKEIRAQLAGRDPGSDLALLRLENGAGSPAERAPQDARVGQLVLAVGRPSLEGLQASLGIVSSVGGPVRSERGTLLEKYLRTDAIPYPGFSGGPLIDSDGRILGINTSGFGPGASLTIPVSIAWQSAETLRQHGKIRRGYLGVRSQGVDLSAAAKKQLGRDQGAGLLLVGVEENSPAEQGGLIVGDIIVGIRGVPVEHHDSLFNQLGADVVGKPTPIEVLRGGDLRTVTVTIGERS
jgi:S1-C subfamily serine protease